MKILLIILASLLLFLQYELWFAHNGIMQTIHLKKSVAVQKKANARLYKRNKLLVTHIYHLKQNRNAVEVLAREELGMIKKGETFYRVIKIHESGS